MQREHLDRLYDRLLVLRCQTADASAFEELVRRYQPALRRFLRRMLDDEHQAEDLLQDVWFEVFRQVGKLENLDAFPGWLWRITRNRAYAILRRRGTVVESAMQTLNGVDVAAAAAAADSDEPALDATEQKQLLDVSLARLNHEQREVLLLRYVEQLSYEQIASAVGCELGTVRSRLFYAKASLKTLMERNGYEHESK